MSNMKGITNYEMRDYLETISKDISSLKTKPSSSVDITFFLIATIFAIIATLLFVIESHVILLFFIISSVACMGAILVKKYLETSD